MTTDPHAGGSVLRAGVPLPQASFAALLLHGRGGSAEDILQLAGEFELPDFAFVAPEARDHIWYPRPFLSPREANEPYLSSALAKVASVIAWLEQTGIPRRHIVVGGFSQGACLATEFVASHPARYGGLIAFTGGLIGPPGAVRDDLLRSAEAPLAGTPALLCSGDPDPYIPWSRVEESAEILSALGARVTTKRYPGRPHTVSREELQLAQSFLAAIRQ